MNFLSGLALLTFSDWIIMIVAGVIVGYSQWKIRSVYKKYSKEIPQGKRWSDPIKALTGKAIAIEILESNGINDVKVGKVKGELTDHYDPVKKEINLSKDIYKSESIAALSIAAHEAGHALQHHVSYFPLRLRHGLLPIANIGSNLAIPLFFIGFIFSWNFFMDAGIWFFIGALLFQMVTLPVEFNASSRALRLLKKSNLFSGTDLRKAKEVLNAAAFTYVAAMSITLLHLIRLIVLRNSRNS